MLVGRAFPGRSRPLCAYPKHAQYAGQGDPDDAKEFPLPGVRPGAMALYRQSQSFPEMTETSDTPARLARRTKDLSKETKTAPGGLLLM